MMLRRHSSALILLAASLISVQLRYAHAQEAVEESIQSSGEPTVEVTQTETVSTENEGGLSLPSRFPFRLSLSVLGGYDDNTNTRGGGQGSAFADGRGNLSYAFAKGDTQITALAGAALVYFPDRTNGRSYDINTNLNLSLSQKVSVRLKLTAAVTASYQVEPDFSSDVGLDTRRGQYFNMVDRFSATYQWSSRFSTVTIYTFRPVKYQNSSVGALADRFEHLFGEELRFTLVPATTLVGEYRYQIVDYDSAPRDSTTHFALAGVDQSIGPRLNLVVRGGASFRSLSNDGDRTSPNFEGALTYALAPDASLNWTARYGFEEPNATGASSRKTFRTGLRVNYKLTRRISSSVVGDYRHDENQRLGSPGISSSDFSRDAFDVSLNLNYALYQHLGLILRYQHTEVASSPTGLDYSRNRYSAGVNFTY